MEAEWERSRGCLRTYDRSGEKDRIPEAREMEGDRCASCANDYEKRSPRASINTDFLMTVCT